MATTSALEEQHRTEAGDPVMARRAALAGGVGTVIEYYDFSVYGFLALTLAPLFFPQQDPATATLSALALFASSYVVRPVGGWFFGILGDKRGRRFSLVATVLLMSAACVAMGLLPEQVHDLKTMTADLAEVQDARGVVSALISPKAVPLAAS
jgi:MHS family proline/betaine transporter-like MFS transporter